MRTYYLFIRDMCLLVGTRSSFWRSVESPTVFSTSDLLLRYCEQPTALIPAIVSALMYSDVWLDPVRHIAVLSASSSHTLPP